jgi:hypothetical protein
MLRLDESRNPIPEGHLYLRDTLFDPAPILQNGIENLIRGMPVQPLQEVDRIVQDHVRDNRLVPDLCAINLQRAREVGAPSYNDARAAFGLPRVDNFTGPTFLPAARAVLSAVYGDGPGAVDKVDPWIGGLLEVPVCTRRLCCSRI